MATEVLDIDEQRRLTLAFFLDGAEQNGIDELCRMLIHVGITAKDIEAADGNTVNAILAHYRKPDGYAWEMVADDMIRYPPIAARIRELQVDKQNASERRAVKDRARKAAKVGRAKTSGIAI